jgi:hypothetical protein
MHGECVDTVYLPSLPLFVILTYFAADFIFFIGRNFPPSTLFEASIKKKLIPPPRLGKLGPGEFTHSVAYPPTHIHLFYTMHCKKGPIFNSLSENVLTYDGLFPLKLKEYFYRHPERFFA